MSKIENLVYLKCLVNVPPIVIYFGFGHLSILLIFFDEVPLNVVLFKSGQNGSKKKLVVASDAVTIMSQMPSHCDDLIEF